MHNFSQVWGVGGIEYAVNHTGLPITMRSPANPALSMEMNNRPVLRLSRSEAKAQPFPTMGMTAAAQLLGRLPSSGPSGGMATVP